MAGGAGRARAGWWHRWGHHSHVNPLFSLPSNVLTSRATLLAETSVLQQQNSELCVLLEEYVSSRVSVSPSSPAAGDTPARVPHTEVPDTGVTVLTAVRLTGFSSPQVNSELLCPPTKWMDLSLACPREAQRAPKAKAEML